MVVAVAEGIVETSGIVGVKNPQIELLYEWGDEEAEEKYEGTGALYEIRYDPENPSRIFSRKVKFSPAFLKRVAKDMSKPMPVIERHEDELRLVAAHEVYQLKVFEKLPQVVLRETDYYQEEGKLDPEKYLKARVEYAAELFALMYLLDRETVNWREALGRFFSASYKWLEISATQMARLKQAPGGKLGKFEFGVKSLLRFPLMSARMIEAIASARKRKE